MQSLLYIGTGSVGSRRVCEMSDHRFTDALAVRQFVLSGK
jgi:hypothetical protein